MNDKEKFCRTFKWEIDIAWFDLTGYTPVDGDRRAKITLSIFSDSGIPTSEHYRGFKVEIVNKNEGVIDSKFFNWSDYLVGGLGEDKFDVISYVAWDWHLATPKDARPISAAIEKYIEIFK